MSAPGLVLSAPGLNGATDTTSSNETDEEPFAENYFEEQGDEDSMTTDVWDVWENIGVYWYPTTPPTTDVFRDEVSLLNKILTKYRSGLGLESNII